MVYITSHLSGQRRTLFVQKCFGSHDLDTPVTYQDILKILHEKEGTCQDISLTCEGRLVGENDAFVGCVNIVATLQLRGGKGGFGSMLRAIGAQIEKTTNREACRDLSGRRLRDINEEKRLKDFLAKKVEKEKERLETKRKKLEQLKEGPKHTFEDKSYFEQREKREKDIYESLDKAFASSSKTKDESFKGSVPKPSKNVSKRRTLDDLDDSSDDSSDEDSNKSEEDNTEQISSTEDSSENEIKKPELDEENGLKRETDNSDGDEHINKKLKT